MLEKYIAEIGDDPVKVAPRFQSIDLEGNLCLPIWFLPTGVCSTT